MTTQRQTVSAFLPQTAISQMIEKYLAEKWLLFAKKRKKHHNNSRGDD